ncbi:starch-binding protein [Reichenbachiella sp.]|uniref:starch-binding protein n=1 Tax=Reichenbachiella sp. TaxID=2184521 RepID=UPI00329A3533
MQKTTTIKFSVLLALLSIVWNLSLAQVANDTRVLLQGFYWEAHDAKPEGWYNHVSGKASELSTAGIDMIWLPPPSDAGSDEGYLPRQLSNLSNGYGSASEHTAMLQNLNNNGIEPIADIVINHRVGSTNWVDFTSPTWGTWSITSNDEVWSQPAYQGLERGNGDTGSGYDAARDLDHTNQGVRDGIKNWLNELKAAGYVGWRYDLVHGYSASYINEYNAATGASFSVGEDWNDKQHIQDWIDGTSATSTGFDFPTYYALKAAIKDNNYSYLAFSEGGQMQASGLIGWSPAQSTTFIENHDTPRYDSGNDVLNGGNVGHAYAYLLTHPGVPTIYWPHYFDWGVKDEINALIVVRKNNGISSSSSLQIIESSSSVYAALIGGKVAMKIGGGDWSPSQAGWSDAGDYVLQASGNNYAVWAKNGGTTNNAPVVSVNPEGPYSSTVPFEVQIAATDDSGLTPTIYYTTNGDEPTTTNSLVSNTGSVTHNVSTSHTLKVMAIDNEGLASATQSHVYNIVSTSDFSVYWKNPNPSATARIHHWNATPSGALSNSTWPGNIMEDASNQYGEGWVKYTFSGITSTNLLFHNGSNQTPDLTRSNTGWYDDGWVSEPTAPQDTEPPTLTVSPSSGNYTGNVAVTLSATDNQDISPTINYTLDGVAFSTEGSTTITISQATTLVASATDDSNNTSASQSHSYTFNPSSNLLIHYKGTLSTPYLYYWSATPNGGQSSGWPGDAMTAEADGWYVFEIMDADCSNIIFSSNGASQSVDLNRCGEGWYQDGTWYDQKPDSGPGFTVYFKPNSYSDPEIYFWGGSQSTSWPGETMTSAGNGWYSYHLDDDCSNIIFSNNGSSQTTDLNRCGDGWYENGNWSGSNPNARFGGNPSNGINENETAVLSVRAFPNPSSSYTNFEYYIPEATMVSLTLHDVTGREIRQIATSNQPSGKYSLQINVSDLDRGIYFYQLKAGTQRMGSRILIE